MSNIQAEVTGGDGPDLAGYPHLAFNPQQWGERVVIASKGMAVEDVAAAAEAAASTRYFTPEQLAEYLGIAADELAEAVRYAREHP